ncbi:hypothetical protein BSNK01_06880 [Bacillaceae bacterium]
MTFTKPMKKEIREKFPAWCNDTGDYVLCMTDDIDSLFSVALLRKVKGYEVNYFYSFDTLYQIKEIKKQVIGVDVAVTNDRKCWDNHVTLFNSNDKPNQNAANLNNIMRISRENYFRKYAMGTHLQIISYYSIFDYTCLQDEQKLILWAIDSSYLGHYSPYINDRMAHRKYIEILEIEEMADVLDRYKPSDFREIQQEYRLNEKIKVNEYGYLETEIALEKLQSLFSCLDLSLPKERFTKRYEFQNAGGMWITDSTDTSVFKRCFSFAITRKNFVNYVNLHIKSDNLFHNILATLSVSMCKSFTFS